MTRGLKGLELHMRIARSLFASLLIASSVFGSSASADTLSGALSRAYENSGLLEQNRATLRAADENVAQAVSRLRPVLSWSASALNNNLTGANPLADFDSNFSTSLSLNLNWLLYDFGASDLAVEAQKQTVLATREALVSFEQQVLQRAVAAYLSVLRDQQFVSLRESNVRLIAEELRAAEERFNLGETTRTSVALAEARLASARSLLAVARGNLVRAEQEYQVAVGAMPRNLAQAPASPVSLSVDAAKAYAVRHHPQIKQLQYSVSASELALERASLAMRPQVQLNSGITLRDDGTESSNISVTVGGPLYNGGAMQSQMRQARHQLDSARAGLHIAVQNIEQNVVVAYANYDVAGAARDAYEQQVAAAEVVFEGTREEASLGARTMLDVLTAEQDLLDARANLVSAQIDEILASYSILAALGSLTVDHLDLSVQRFDPEAYYELVKSAPIASSARGQALDRVLSAIGD